MSKPGHYTREDVVETALRILDEFGLADLSMRRLAGVLGVQPSALYWHVPNKQTLLALVADQIIDRAATVDHAVAGDWKAITLAESIAIRDALLAFRDGAEVVSSTLALGLGADGALARIRVGIDAVCPDVEMARIASESILFLILGQVWHEQQRMQADSLGVVSPTVAADPADLNLDSDSLGFSIELILGGLEKKLTLKHESR
jgi:TetR/AcrR family transcriptional regulator, tetracycline repressor protein